MERHELLRLSEDKVRLNIMPPAREAGGEMEAFLDHTFLVHKGLLRLKIEFF